MGVLNHRSGARVQTGAVNQTDAVYGTEAVLQTDAVYGTEAVLQTDTFYETEAVLQTDAVYETASVCFPAQGPARRLDRERLFLRENGLKFS